MGFKKTKRKRQTSRIKIYQIPNPSHIVQLHFSKRGKEKKFCWSNLSKTCAVRLTLITNAREGESNSFFLQSSPILLLENLVDELFIITRVSGRQCSGRKLLGGGRVRAVYCAETSPISSKIAAA